MKLPSEISLRLTQQWYKGDIREKRLLSADVWPLKIAIGRPTAQVFVNDSAKVREHVKQWRKIKVGEIIWKQTKYRDSSEEVELPTTWELASPSEWIAATDDKDVVKEFHLLSHIVSETSAIFHQTIIRKRSIYHAKTVEEIILATKIAEKLTPQCARGKPLRALSISNCDTKFFERNKQLLTELLDLLYDNTVSKIGLENFLGAINEKEHWLLVIPLDKTLLPFQQLRIRSSELLTTCLPGTHLIVVENEQCSYLLPSLPDTVAILGAGLNISWLKSTHYHRKKIAYWGDIDSWGLTMLAKARALQPNISALLMNHSLFIEYQKQYAVNEPESAAIVPPPELTADEVLLYKMLLTSDRGRLEQEFIPEEVVKQVLLRWRAEGQKQPEER